MKSIETFENRIIQGDCVEVMKKIPARTIDLIFADPPFNIGLKYDNYRDRRKPDEYLLWCRTWIEECVRVLADHGSMYIAMNDENVAELVVLLKSLGLHIRNWIIWYYTSALPQGRMFARHHTHIIYCAKNKGKCIFNADAVRIESAGMRTGDKRVNPRGKVPDDVWCIPRVSGTFKERVRGFPCHMPEKVMERIIKASSNSGGIVLDPFSGSGTTAAVAKKLGRRFVGIELSARYKALSERRLKVSD